MDLVNQFENIKVESVGLNINAPEFVPRFSQKIVNPEPVPETWDDFNMNSTDNKTNISEDISNSINNGSKAPDLQAVTTPSESRPIPRVDSKSSLPDSGRSSRSRESDPGLAVPCVKIDTNRKESVNIIFCGHVDAGKSTIGGHLLYLTGMVDQRTLEKYSREAKEKGRDSWYLSWALDTNSEEREKGKTVECGRGYFETARKHFTLLDAPGHKSFVPNMISGAAQADLSVLVISARRGEFETGFEKGGQTREHATLIKTAGTKHLIVLINKMDDPTVNWSEERYLECVEKLQPFLKRCGFNPKSDLFFMPCSGYTGAFLKDIPPESTCPWYRGPAFLDYIDQLPSLTRNVQAPLRMPIADKYRDMGTYVIGKIEAGGLEKGQSLVLMPNKNSVEVGLILIDDMECESAIAGDNVKLRLKNVEEEEISSGFVLCHPLSLCHVGSLFEGKVIIKEHKSILCPGYSAVIHLHTCVEEVTLVKILATMDSKGTDVKELMPRFVRQGDMAIIRFKILGGSICMEKYKDYPQMGRFTIRDEGKTVAVGTIVKVFQTDMAAQDSCNMGVAASAQIVTGDAQIKSQQ